MAISGDTVVVGTPYAAVGGNLSQGAAYVFERNLGGADNWGQVQKLTASDGAAVDFFGNSVAISGDTVVVGAPYADVGGNDGQGEAYVYRLDIPDIMRVFLPLIAQDYASAPDPAVDHAIATSSAMMGGIGNAGTTVDHTYYFPEYSSTPPLPTGANVYVPVDSFNYAITYGAVQESDEGNDRLPVVSAANVGDKHPPLARGSPPQQKAIRSLPSPALVQRTGRVK